MGNICGSQPVEARGYGDEKPIKGKVRKIVSAMSTATLFCLVNWRGTTLSRESDSS